MRKLWVFVISLGLLFAFQGGLAAAAEKKSLTYYSYENEEELDQTVAKTTVKVKNISKDQTELIRQKETEDEVVNDAFVLDEDYSLQTWTRTSEDTDTDITSERVGDKLIVKGKLKGEEVDKEVNLGDQLLYIYPEYSLGKFAMSDAQKMRFWTLRRDKMDKLPMQARNEGETKVVVNGEEIDAIKVYYSITGKLREKHFNHNYYYRKSDGLFVKKEENKGRIEELVQEK